MNELLTSLKINAEMTDEERKEIEKIYENVRKRIEGEGQKQDFNKKIGNNMNDFLSKEEIEDFLNELQDCTCDDCDNEPPTFEDGIIYAYENVVKMLIEKVFE